MNFGQLDQILSCLQVPGRPGCTAPPGIFDEPPPPPKKRLQFVAKRQKLRCEHQLGDQATSGPTVLSPFP